MSTKSKELYSGCNHPDLSLKIYDLNYRKSLHQDIEIILNHIRKMLSDYNRNLTDEDKRFIQIQLDLVDTLRLFPLRKLN